MILLALDTSTDHGSVALLRDGDLLLNETFSAERSHSASLFAVLERARSLVESIDTIAVGLGPGSYAGIRIAISAAIGFQIALGCKLVGLPSVAALEVSATDYCVIGDARREVFYFTRMQADCCVDGPRLVTAAELQSLDAQFSADPFFATFELPALPRALVALPTARRLAELALAEKCVVSEDALEPLYLREAHITVPKIAPPKIQT